jgi:hypothetical protein
MSRGVDRLTNLIVEERALTTLSEGASGLKRQHERADKAAAEKFLILGGRAGDVIMS